LRDIDEIELRHSRRLDCRAADPKADRRDRCGHGTHRRILDSLAILNLVGFLEERFNVMLPIEEFVPENFRTPAAIAALAARLSEKAA
jgi:hypothetical protein